MFCNVMNYLYIFVADCIALYVTILPYAYTSQYPSALIQYNDVLPDYQILVCK